MSDLQGVKGERGFSGPIGDKGDEVGSRTVSGRVRIWFYLFVIFYNEHHSSTQGPPGVPGLPGVTGRPGTMVS